MRSSDLVRVLLVPFLALNLTHLLAQEPVSCAHPSLTISGSATVGQELMLSLFRAFLQEKNTQPTITGDVDKLHQCLKATMPDGSLFVAFLRADGTNRGTAEFINHTCDIVMASRRVTPDELGRQPHREISLCVDALEVIVNPENPIKSLTLQQVREIFNGSITNWSQVSGSSFSGPIRVYCQPAASGTADMFRLLAMHGDEITSSAIQTVDQTSLSSSVSIEPFAIGFVGMAFKGEAKAVLLARTPQSTPVMASPTTLLNEEYPLMRRLYLYARAPYHAVWAEFIDFLANNEKSQEVIVEEGFTPIFPFLDRAEAEVSRE